MWPILVLHPKRVFFFSLWESLFCHHIEYWPKLVAGSVVCPASWLGEFLRSFSWCQTSLLQRRHWGIARCTWHSCSKKDVGTSWKYWHMHKNLLWEGRPRETSHRLVSHTPGEMVVTCSHFSVGQVHIWAIPSLSCWVLFLSHAANPSLDCSQMVGRESIVRKKITRAAIPGLEEINLDPFKWNNSFLFFFLHRRKLRPKEEICPR